MKTNHFYKESIFWFFLLCLTVFFAAIGVTSYAGASSLDRTEYKHTQNQFKTIRRVAFSPQLAKQTGMSEQALIDMLNVAEAVEKYKEYVAKSTKASSSVMAVYWKIEAVDRLGETTQAQFDSVNELIHVDQDAIRILVMPKNISALADPAKASDSPQKKQRRKNTKRVVASILDSIDASLH